MYTENRRRNSRTPDDHYNEQFYYFHSRVAHGPRPFFARAQRQSPPHNRGASSHNRTTNCAHIVNGYDHDMQFCIPSYMSICGFNKCIIIHLHRRWGAVRGRQASCSCLSQVYSLCLLQCHL